MAKTPKPEQLDLALPQPARGGSYVRRADGSLELLERTEDPKPPEPPADEAPAEETAP